jgi:hypothetical protein
MTEPPGDADQAMTTTRISPAVVPTIVVAAVHRSLSVIRSSGSRSTAAGGTSSVSPVAISQAMTERRQEVPLGGRASPRAIRGMSSLLRRMASGSGGGPAPLQWSTLVGFCMPPLLHMAFPPPWAAPMRDIRLRSHSAVGLTASTSRSTNSPTATRGGELKGRGPRGMPT